MFPLLLPTDTKLIDLNANLRFSKQFQWDCIKYKRFKVDHRDGSAGFRYRNCEDYQNTITGDWMTNQKLIFFTLLSFNSNPTSVNRNFS